MVNYDKYYATEELFGKPYPELVDFFDHFEPKGKLLDIGCGQGRDSLSLARLGYKVTGIDYSKIGIAQMIEKSEEEGLEVTGLVGDIYTFDHYKDFDIVLLDSMFHFAKKDIARETGLIRKIASQIKNAALICFCIQDTGNKVEILKETIKNTRIGFETINDSSLIYNFTDKKSAHKSTTSYCLFIIKKDN